jgi:YD repeat-containing protein
MKSAASCRAIIAAGLTINLLAINFGTGPVSARTNPPAKVVAVTTPPLRMPPEVEASRRKLSDFASRRPQESRLAPRLPHTPGVHVAGPPLLTKPFHPKNAPLDPHAMSPSFRQLHGIAIPQPLATAPPLHNSLSSVSRPAPAAPVSVGAPMAVRRLATVSLTTPSYTGFNNYWTYQGDALPGVGSYAANVGPGGNLMILAGDMSVPHKGIALEFRRTYNSLSRHDYLGTDGSQISNYGAGWTNTFDAHIAFNSGNQYGQGISVYDIDGARYDYLSDGQGHWLPPAGQYATLTYDGGNGYFWTKKTGTVYYFWYPFGASLAGLSGRLSAIYGRNNNTSLSFSYSFDNFDDTCSCHLSVINVIEEDGRYAQLLFNDFTVGGQSQRLLSKLIWPNGTSVSYSYDTSGNLAEVDEPPNNTVSTQCQGGLSQCLPQLYGYISGSLIYWVAGPRQVMSWRGIADWTGTTQYGSYVMFGFDGNNALSAVGYDGYMNPTPSDFTNTPIQPGLANGTYYKSVYMALRTSTSVYWGDSDGHQSFYTFDSIGRVTQKEALVGSSYLTRTAGWDAQNNLIFTTSPAVLPTIGSETDFAYDTNGNLIASALPSLTTSDGTFRPTALTSYDSNNNPIAVCDPHFSHYHQPSLDWTTRPAASDTLCPAQVGSQSSGGSTIASWSSITNEPFGQLQTITNPAGYATSFYYDSTREGGSADYGLPTTVSGTTFQQFDNTSVQPSTTSTYNAYGDVITSTQSMGSQGSATSTLTYDTIGRPTSATDPDNQQNRVSYNADGSVSLSQTPAQYAANTGVSMAYDGDSNLVNEAHSFTCTAGNACTQGSTIRWYDGADRLVEVQLPNDSTDYYPFPWLTRYVYDLSVNQTVTIGTSQYGSATVSAHGNQFKQQTCVTAAIQSYSNPGSSCQWLDQKGAAFDSLDRPVSQYFYQPGGNLQSQTMTYDATSSTIGLLSSTHNALGETTAYGYDAAGRVSSISFTAASNYPGSTSSVQTPSRNYVYDTDGRVSSIATTAFGTEAATYLPDGSLATITEPTGGSGIAYYPSTTFAGTLSSPATISYAYYPNGWRSGVSVASAGLSQNNLKQYSYRGDGLLQKRSLNALGQAIWQGLSYTAGGRLLNEGDLYNSSARSMTYDQYGQLSSLQITSAGTYTSIQHDLEGGILSYNISPSLYGQYGGPTSISNTYNVRGELLSQGCGNLGVSQICASAHGFLYPPDVSDYCVNYQSGRWGDTACGTQYTKFDARNGANLGTPVHFTSFDGTNNQNNRPTDAQYSTVFAYDLVGRQLGSQTNGFFTGGTAWFDIENHVAGSSQVSGLRYAYGPDGNLLFSEQDGTNPDGSWYYRKLTHHWDGGNLLFTTDSSNNVQHLLLDKTAEIMPQTSYTAPTFFDRDFSGTVVSAHNATGYGGLFYGSLQTQPNVYAPPLFPASSAGFSMGLPSTNNGPLLHFWRTDGYYDGFQTIQGARSYYGSTGQWASMDAYGGDPMSPMSGQPYVWNGNDSISSSDPTGYYFQHCTHDCGFVWDGPAFGGPAGGVKNGKELIGEDNSREKRPGCVGNPGGAFTLPKTDLTGQPLSWSSIYAAGAANFLDPGAYWRNFGNGGRFDIQQKDPKSIPLRYTGNVANGIYGLAAGFTMQQIDLAIVAVALKNLAPGEIPQDQYLAHVGMNFSSKHCK